MLVSFGIFFIVFCTEVGLLFRIIRYRIGNSFDYCVKALLVIGFFNFLIIG